MRKKIITLLISLVVLLVIGCPNSVTMWTGVEYTGTLTKSDPLGDTDYYYDTYYLGCAGTWTFELESLDGIYIYINDENIFGIETFDVGTDDSLTTKSYILAGTEIYVSVYKDSGPWADNDYKADYKLKATLN
ncbi:MAG: hypothetical protein KAT05_00595 [Spirochaetes bacterium]|nr:hypothetical protein [Spirochaetota bacterium]